MRLNVSESLRQLQQENRLFATLFRNGSLEIEIYKPQQTDLQKPHTRDELYVVATGRSRFASDREEYCVIPGDVLFVPAGVVHRFCHFTEDFSTWVFFYGPEGGEGS